MRLIHRIGREIPGLPQTYHFLRHLYVRRRTRRFDRDAVFADLIRTNGWNGRESASGTGSDSLQTRVIVAEVPQLLRELGIASLLDLPCGDFHWLRQADLQGIEYVGGDVIRDLVDRNTALFGAEGVSFRRLDILEDELPLADMVLCRDCLVHFSFLDVWRALDNICRSGAEYLLTTTFPERLRNADIIPGEWRALNLCAAPFRLPPPIRLINEQCAEVNGAYADKSLGLWRVADIRRRLEQRGGRDPLGRVATLLRSAVRPRADTHRPMEPPSR